ncbi:hypothetical protein [Singulisphaera sp. PoT]|uniref:hypothetical protein n=1 Tax=Singulisphaera sp. PoT TaxID=3411797 RepID=UPI003BF49CBB
MSLTASVSSGYVLGDAASATATIADNPSAAAPPVVTIAATDASAAELGQDTATYTISRSGPTTSPLTVTYGMSGTAAFNDYTGLPNFSTLYGTGSVTIPAGQASISLTLTPNADALAEASESAVMSLTASVSSGYVLGDAASATATIADNPSAAAPPVVTIAATDASAAELGQDTATYTISRSGPTTSPLTVTYGMSGTAAFNDYTGLPNFSTLYGTGSVTIPAGQASISLTLTPNADALAEASESAVMSLTASVSSGYVLGDAASRHGDHRRQPLRRRAARRHHRGHGRLGRRTRPGHGHLHHLPLRAHHLAPHRHLRHERHRRLQRLHRAAQLQHTVRHGFRHHTRRPGQHQPHAHAHGGYNRRSR